MATHTLKTPMHVGDLVGGITVDHLDLTSVAINFQPENKNAIVSCMLRHPESGWIHTVTLSEHTGRGLHADALWAEIKKTFPDFEKKILAMLTEHLPEGTIS